MDTRTHENCGTCEAGVKRREALRRLALIVPTLMFLPEVSTAQTVIAKEHQLKAAFIFNFITFVEWPPNTFESPTAPLLIDVAGQTPIFAELGKAVKDRKIDGRPLIVRPVETPDEARVTHLLFVPASEDYRCEKWLSAVEKASVLTIGESEAFARRGGMINFVQEVDKLRFEINMDSVDAAHLRIGAQLQKLAKTLRRKKQ